MTLQELANQAATNAETAQQQLEDSLIALASSIAVSVVAIQMEEKQ